MSHVHLGELEIARLLLDGGELPAHAADCAGCRVAIDQARRDAASFARTVGPHTLPAIEARLARWRTAWVATAGLAAVAAVVVMWFAFQAMTRAIAVPRAPVIAAKGGPALHVMARHQTAAGDHVFEADDGTRLAPGDAIRFVIDTDGARYVLVVSIDGAGQLNVYHPYRGDRSAAVDAASRRVVVDGSIILDDAPGPERIWAVISDRPIAVAELRAQLAAIQAGGAPAIRRGAELAIPGARQISRWFDKPAVSTSPERAP